MNPSFALREEQEHPYERSRAQHRIDGFQLDFTDRRGSDFASEPESAYIFTKVGAELHGRIGSGDGEIDPHARTNGFAITGYLRAAPPEEEHAHRCFNLCKCGIGESPT